MRRLLIVLLCLPCAAQYNGNAPQIVQAFISGTDGSIPNQIVMRQNVGSGHLLVACAAVNDTGANTYPISDTLATTWTTLTPIFQVGTGGRNSTNFQMYYGVTSASGADTVTIDTGGLGQFLAAAEFVNVGGTIDVNTSATAGGTPKAITTSPVTTNNGDLIATCTAGASDTTSKIVPIPPNEYIAAADPMGMSMTRVGMAGTYNISTHNQNTEIIAASAWSNFLIQQSLAFKPSTVAVTTTQMPKGDTVSPYKATLAAVGGTGASYTWTLASGTLPSGLTLHTGTGVIDGTATGTGTSAFQVHVSDGTTTSSDVGLSITIGQNFQIPFIRQTAFQDGVGTSSNIPFSNPVIAGDAILVFGKGADTHGRLGWARQSLAVTDTLGSTFVRGCPLAGTYQSALDVFVAEAPTSGANTVFVYATPGGNLSSVAVDVGNAQGILSCGGTGENDTILSTPYTLSASYISQVANELLLVATSEQNTGAPQLSSMSFSAPFSQVGSLFLTGFDSLALADYLATSAGSQTATTTVNANSGHVLDADLSTTLLIGIRPDAPAQVTANLGEKHRRQIW